MIITLVVRVTSLSIVDCDETHDAASLLHLATDHITNGRLSTALPLLNMILNEEGTCATSVTPTTQLYARFHRAAIGLAFGHDVQALTDATSVSTLASSSRDAWHLLLRAQLHTNAAPDVIRSTAARLWSLDKSLKSRHQQLQRHDPPLIQRHLLDIPTSSTRSLRRSKQNQAKTKRIDDISTPPVTLTTLTVGDSSYNISGTLSMPLLDGRTVSIYRLNAPLPVYLIPDFLTPHESDELSQLLTNNIDIIDHSSSPNRNNDSNGVGMGPLLCFSRGSQRQEELNNHDNILFPVDAHGSVSCINHTRTANHRLAYQYPYSRSTLVYGGDHSLTDTVNERIEHVCGLSRAHSSYTQLLRYQSAVSPTKSNIKDDDGYALHTDCTSDIGSNTRTWTFLAYLDHNDSGNAADGGYTSFPLMNISVAPHKGMALVFRSVDDDGYCVANSRHMSTPLTIHPQQTQSHASRNDDMTNNEGTPIPIVVMKSVLQKWFMSQRYDHQPYWGDDPVVQHLSTAMGQRSYVTCSVVGSCREYAPLYDAPSVTTTIGTDGHMDEL